MKNDTRYTVTLGNKKMNINKDTARVRLVMLMQLEMDAPAYDNRPTGDALDVYKNLYAQFKGDRFFATAFSKCWLVYVGQNANFEKQIEQAKAKALRA